MAKTYCAITGEFLLKIKEGTLLMDKKKEDYFFDSDFFGMFNIHFSSFDISLVLDVLLKPTSDSNNMLLLINPIENY